MTAEQRERVTLQFRVTQHFRNRLDTAALKMRVERGDRTASMSSVAIKAITEWLEREGF